MRCYILDHHRPFHLKNLYSRHNVVCFDEEFEDSYLNHEDNGEIYVGEDVPSEASVMSSEVDDEDSEDSDGNTLATSDDEDEGDEDGRFDEDLYGDGEEEAEFDVDVKKNNDKDGQDDKEAEEAEEAEELEELEDDNVDPADEEEEGEGESLGSQDTHSGEESEDDEEEDVVSEDTENELEPRHASKPKSTKSSQKTYSSEDKLKSTQAKFKSSTGTELSSPKKKARLSDVTTTASPGISQSHHLEGEEGEEIDRTFVADYDAGEAIDVEELEEEDQGLEDDEEEEYALNTKKRKRSHFRHRRSSFDEEYEEELIEEEEIGERVDEQADDAEAAVYESEEAQAKREYQLKKAKKQEIAKYYRRRKTYPRNAFITELICFVSLIYSNLPCITHGFDAFANCSSEIQCSRALTLRCDLAKHAWSNRSIPTRSYSSRYLRRILSIPQSKPFFSVVLKEVKFGNVFVFKYIRWS